MEKVTINFQNKQLSIDSNMLELCENYDVEINDEYINYLTSFIGSYERLTSVINELIMCDICNRYFSSLYGQVLCINEDGETGYECLWKAIIDNIDKRSFYTFEDLKEYGGLKEKYNFFGINTEIVIDDLICTLNKEIKIIYRWYNKEIKELTQKKSKTVARKRINRDLKSWSFGLGRFLWRLERRHEREEKERATKKEYEMFIKNIINRYSLNGKTIFNKVKNLNDYNDVCGIYVFCLDSKRKIYIGQTRRSLRERIREHLRELDVDFDYYLNPYNISKIYVLKISDKYQDVVEQDCIAFTPRKISLNSVATTENAIYFVDSSNLDFLLADDKLRLKIINDSIKHFGV